MNKLSITTKTLNHRQTTHANDNWMSTHYVRVLLGSCTCLWHCLWHCRQTLRRRCWCQRQMSAAEWQSARLQWHVTSTSRDLRTVTSSRDACRLRFGFRFSCSFMKLSRFRFFTSRNWTLPTNTCQSVLNYSALVNDLGLVWKKQYQVLMLEGNAIENVRSYKLQWQWNGTFALMFITASRHSKNVSSQFQCPVKVDICIQVPTMQLKHFDWHDRHENCPNTDKMVSENWTAKTRLFGCQRLVQFRLENRTPTFHRILHWTIIKLNTIAQQQRTAFTFQRAKMSSQCRQYMRPST